MTAFGEALYEALRERGEGQLLTRLGFAELQAFKEADREEAVRLLRGELDYEALQRLKNDAPEELAEFWARREELRMATTAAQMNTGWPFWIFFLAMLGGS